MGRSVHAVRGRIAALAATLAMVSLAASVAPASADHSRFEHVSFGTVNGNGVQWALYGGGSDHGTVTYFTTDEQLTNGDTDAVADV